jgi:catechol 2,3-dioxygenase-like lactoylglutathione lyase family enzyme
VRHSGIVAAMIDHVSVRCSDLARAVSFYRQALAPLGYQVLMEFPGAVGLGAGGKPDFWLTAGVVGTPLHIAFGSDRAAVDAFHRAALAAGGQDHGAPGLRPEYHRNYYGAFVLDPDGHNVEAVCHAPPGVPRAAKKTAKKAGKKKAGKKKAAKKTSAKKKAAKPIAKKKAAKKKAAKKTGARRAAPQRGR